jgi:L-lactate dehydrogenase complex protein LldG
VDAVARSPAAAGSLLPRVVARPATTARDEILPRIADALADVPVGEQPGDVAVPRRYERGAQGDIVEQFVERVSEYRADVRRVAGAELAATVAEVCRERGIVRLGVPADLPAAWLPGGVEAQAAERLDPRALDTLGDALTGCALAIAETARSSSTPGPGKALGRCRSSPTITSAWSTKQIVAGPRGDELDRAHDRATRRPVTLVSGPSARSDIELDRVEGVQRPA